ncbi:hypothetical protein MKW98_030820 [Papaver atlanticum]|uniref:F-box associated beta-propeller type 3 domain-containing protein n=1 Tax=Papaver atlanticum TaxID=357466 RepID=A0AAD4X5R3_9MAGN|nr:hypothetical protein MKW98_030820 [Papaver atlanticum]
MELKNLEDEECEIIVAQEMQNLLSDEIYEILIRASMSMVPSGHLFQVVSKTRPTFVSFVRSNNDSEKHCDSAQEVQSPSLDFLPAAKSITIAGSSLHGSLLCCVTKSSSTPIPSFYMCKPASRKWREIPNPNTTFEYSSIGIAVKQSSCSILNYKILRLSQPETGYGYHCELFNLETWAWKTLPFVQFKRDCTFLIGEDGIWVNGGLHWLSRYDELYAFEVFVFNTDQEKWTTFEISPEMKTIPGSNRVAVSCDGKLGIIYHTNEWMELWVLENYSTTKPTWKRKYRSDLRSLHQNYELIAFNCDENTYTRTKLPRTADILGLSPYPFQPQFCYL